jgi:hypothetical protein
MRTPFTVEQFFDVFASYNVAVWPAPVVAYLLGLLAVVLAFRGKAPSGRIISGVLALFWFWMGLVYHLGHLRRINPAANLFGAFFILQGLLFLIDSYRGGLSFRPRQDPRSLAGAVIIIYSMLGYPLIGQAFGHFYPRAPMFGIAPCPTTIFTFGILLWTAKPVPCHLLAIPFLWSLIGTSAAVNLQVPQDYGLGIAGVAGTLLLAIGHRNRRGAQPDA